MRAIRHHESRIQPYAQDIAVDFIHLHNHTDYSILDGAITVDRLISQAAAFGMPGVAMTDHGNMFGAIEFYQKARAKGIKPILGQEFYVAPRSRFEREPRSDGKDTSHHLLLIARDLEGYKNLIKLSSYGYTEGFYFKPRIDRELLEAHSRGLICASACLGGIIPSYILAGKTDEAANIAGFYNELFGPDSFYLELQDHGIKEQAIVNRELVALSARLGIPLIATNDCHFPRKEDSFSHEILLCIQTGKTLENEQRMRFSSDQFYFKSSDEMYALFADYPDALYNTYKIFEMVDVTLNLGDAILPHFAVPEGFTLNTYLEHLVAEGARKRFGEPVPATVLERIEYELSVITRMNFSGYFLVVWDFINYAKSQKIPVGPGRGSAAGSMVSYCLGITELDPIRYNLLFERFLNPDRNEMPDMDIDFCANRREEIIAYVKQKYGETHVSQIITFNKMKAKAVVKDVARVLNIPFTESNEITKLITENTLEEVMKTSKEFKEIAKSGKKGKTLVDTALNLEGLVRSAGKHAAGIVISREPLVEYVPLYKDAKDGSISTQFEKVSLEKAGLVKMDFLGLKNLSIIDACVKRIAQTRGVAIDIGAIPLDDEPTFRLLQEANTLGVFQLESAGMQNILRKLKPTALDDIIAVNALYRPGPLDSGMVDDYIIRKRNPAKISYPHASLEPVLKDTLGVIVYQEQVMLISQVIAGFSLPEADKLRKAMGKKDEAIMNALEEKFVKGAHQKGHDPSFSENLYSMIKQFSRYAFNKSHSAAYAMVAYQTAYLKAHYTAEFMAALLSAQPDSQEDVIKYINDCKANGIAVLPPSVNSSEYDFTIENGSIRFGLSAIKGIGEKAIESIIAARKRCGTFATLEQFLENIDLFAVNKGVIESLAKAGALDALHPNRAQLLAATDHLLETAKRIQLDKSSGQGSLFDFNEPDGPAKTFSMIELPQVRDWHDNEKLVHEKEVLGIYVSGHPLAKYENEIKALSCTSIARLSEKKTSGDVSIIGIITNLKKRTSKNGNQFAVGVLEDMEGMIETIFFPNVYTKHAELIESDSPVMVIGNIEYDDATPKKLMTREVKSLQQIQREAISAVHIRLDLVGVDDNLLNDLKSIMERNKGECQVFLHLSRTNGDEQTIRVHHTFNISPSERLIKDITGIVGQDAIFYSLGHC